MTNEGEWRWQMAFPDSIPDGLLHAFIWDLQHFMFYVFEQEGGRYDLSAEVNGADLVDYVRESLVDLGLSPIQIKETPTQIDEEDDDAAST